MNISKTHKQLAGLLSIAFLFAVFGGLSVQEAEAQYRRGVVWGTGGGGTRNLTRIAETYGRSDGLREGANAVRDRKRYSPYSESKYRKGTNGYNRRLGSKAVYKRVYQDAFVRGYNEGYYRNRRGVRQNRRDW